MKGLLKIFICILLLFLQGKKIISANIDDTFIGGSISYNSAIKNFNNLKSYGEGFSIYYRSYFNRTLSYLLYFNFLYNEFEYNETDNFYNPLTGEYEIVNYRKNEKFINHSIGYLLNYTILLNEKIIKSKSKILKNIFPEFSTGLLFNFIYKKINYSYKNIPSSFITAEEESRFLPTTISIPLNFSIYYFITKKWWISSGISYNYILYNDVVQKLGYNNILQFHLGCMYKINFKI